MIIENAQWCSIEPVINKTTALTVTIDGVEMTVPLDPANRHYAAILKWVAEGNTIEEAD